MAAFKLNQKVQILFSQTAPQYNGRSAIIVRTLMLTPTVLFYHVRVDDVILAEWFDDRQLRLCR